MIPTRTIITVAIRLQAMEAAIRLLTIEMALACMKALKLLNKSTGMRWVLSLSHTIKATAVLAGLSQQQPLLNLYQLSVVNSRTLLLSPCSSFLTAMHQTVDVREDGCTRRMSTHPSMES
jgi:hypothetical protein